MAQRLRVSAVVTAPRIIVPGATTAITRRTTLRKGFLAPWDPRVQQAWLYSLADAQRTTGVAVHHGTRVVTHHHTTVTPASDNLPEFVRRLHRDVSCSLNTLLTLERYDAPGELFDGRSAHYMRLLDAPAQASHLIYEYLNCVAAGLVDRPEHMPDHWFNFELWLVGHLDVHRPDFYFKDDRPEVIRMEVTPPPLLYRAFGGDMERLVHHMKRTAEAAGRTLRAARKRAAMGARKVQRLHPWSEPTTLRESGGQRVPTFRIGARGIAGLQAAAQAAAETHRFRRCYGEGMQGYADGGEPPCFPYGTYAMRLRHHVPVAPAPREGEALVTAPGPVLADVKAELEAERARGAKIEKHPGFELLQDVHDAFEEEAAQLCEQETLELQDGKSIKATVLEAVRGEQERPEGAMRHRFDKAKRRDELNQAGPDGARRLVVLRDRRRGRLPGTARRHGADPPR